jgi:uncharacterized protein (TIGR03437 family)
MRVTEPRSFVTEPRPGVTKPRPSGSGLRSLLLAALSFISILSADAPIYSADSLVNSADNQSGWLAPNAIATLYGKNLAYGTKTLSSDDIRAGVLPTVLPNTGVRLLVNGLPGNPYYVSPTQINFLIPPNLLPGSATVQLVIDGLAGPPINVQLGAAAPALFQLDQQNIIATRADGSLITPAASAKPGDTVVLYATGLGPTVPPVGYGELPSSAAPLKLLTDFHVLLDGSAVDPSAIPYAGIAPGFAGLYQINLILPASTGANPEIRLGIADAISKSGLHIPVSP